ncbi:MAG: SDR family oxidoreductase [Gammaproteobacteria bacterium]|nr:SDR family oxidoreductase [Gammaproteobacteria bacterium]
MLTIRSNSTQTYTTHGQPEEIADMAVFLAGPKSQFITGQCFGVNGGSVMH